MLLGTLPLKHFKASGRGGERGSKHLAVSLLHALNEVGGPEEPLSQAFFHLILVKPFPLFTDQDPDKLGVFLSPQQDEMVPGQFYIHLLPEGPEGKGGIGEMACILDHSGSDGVAVDVPDAGEVVLVGVDDAGLVAISPQMSCPAHRPVEPDGKPGVEVLHGPVEVLFRGGGEDMVMVGHEDDVVDKKLIFFHSFREGLEHDAGGLPLVEPEGLIVGPAYQVVGIGGLNDSQRTCHDPEHAKALPKSQNALTPVFSKVG